MYRSSASSAIGQSRLRPLNPCSIEPSTLSHRLDSRSSIAGEEVKSRGSALIQMIIRVNSGAINLTVNEIEDFA